MSNYLLWEILHNFYHFRRHTTEFKTNDVVIRVLDELVPPLRQLELDDREFACLKAIVFFDAG